MEDLQIDIAKAVVTRSGYFMRLAVLDHLAAGDVVRISFTLTQQEETEDYYTHDSPYVRIVDIVEGEIVGEVLGLNHDEASIKYPIRAGERIWFKKENIFEINEEELNEERRAEIEEFIVEPRRHVIVTGVLMLLEDD